MARILFPALVLVLVEVGGDGGGTCEYGDADCDGGKSGSDETLIESVGVLEEESKALEEVEDDDVDNDQPEAEQDDDVLVRRHYHRAAEIGR